MPLTCHTCFSPHRAEIERLAASGRPLAAISREFSLSYPSVRGHFAKEHHLRRPVPYYVPQRDNSAKPR